MKLHSPAFEKALKRGAKEAIRRSPELKREARRANRSFRRHYKSGWLVRGMFSLLVGACSAGIASQRGHAPAALAFVNLWTFAWVFFRVQLLVVALYQSSDLQAFSFLPIEKSELFRWELQKFYRGSLMSLLDLIAGFGAIALFSNSPTALTVVIPVAILGWGAMLAVVMLCGARWPRLPYVQISMFIIFAALALLFGQNLVGSWLIETLQRFAVPLNVLLPTGWAPSLFLFAMGSHDWTLALLLIPIGAVLSTMPSSLARLRRRYEFKELVYGQAPDLLPAEVSEESVAVTEPGVGPLRVDSDAITPIVRTHLFPIVAPWRERGWMEKILWRWLSPREYILAEFVFPHGISILPGWKKNFRNAGITCLAALVAELILPGAEGWVLTIGFGVTAVQVMGRLLTSGIAFRRVRSSGLDMPFYANYGIGFRELSRFLLKYTAVQIPFLILIWLLCGGFYAYMSHMPIGFGLEMSFKAAGLMIALRCVFMTLSFSSGINENIRLRLRSLVVLAVLLIFGGLFFGLAIGGLFQPNVGLSWLLWSLALVDAYVLLAVYGWFYNGRWFDLMITPRR